jgi:hypothetical protein
MQRIFLQQLPSTSNNFSSNNFLQTNNRPKNIITATTSTSSTSSTSSTTTTDTEQTIVYKDVNGNTSTLGNVLTTNYGLFLQSYIPTCNLSKTYGIVANSKGEPYTLTKNYSVIPVSRNFNIYDV